MLQLKVQSAEGMKSWIAKELLEKYVNMKNQKIREEIETWKDFHSALFSFYSFHVGLQREVIFGKELCKDVYYLMDGRQVL